MKELELALRQVQEHAKQARIEGSTDKAETLDAQALLLQQQQHTATVDAALASATAIDRRRAACKLQSRLQAATAENERMQLLRRQTRVQRELLGLVTTARKRREECVAAVAHAEAEMLKQQAHELELQQNTENLELEAQQLIVIGKHVEGAAMMRRAKSVRYQCALLGNI